MCGRASLSQVEKQLEVRFKASFFPKVSTVAVLPNYNIAPTQLHPVITNQEPEHLQYFRWGLIPFWAKEASIGSRMINARIETISEKPAFRQAIQKRRCLVPLDGFYEWKKRGKEKIPYRIVLKEEQIFCVAGIWETWQPPNGPVIHSFSILTQPPNELMRDIHNRMPAILFPEQESLWIDRDIPTKDVLAAIQPFPSELMKAFRVSKRVNKVGENDVDLLKEVDAPLPPEQGRLF
ncbi:MAG: SOS response-associated peptidase [Bacteroidota bacterium]